MKKWLLVGGALVGLALGSEAQTAHAQSGVVLQFRGPRGGSARSAALRGSRGRLELVTLNKARRAAREAGAGINSRRGRRAIADALELDYIISGRVSGRGTRIELYDADGSRLRRVDAPRPTTRGNRTRIQDAVSGMLAEELGGEEEEAEQEEAREPAGRSLDDIENEAPPSDGEREIDEDDDEPLDSNELLLPKVVALVGADARRRSIEVRLAETGETRNYRTAALYPDITLQLQVRPLNRAEVARGLYFQLDTAFAVGLSTNERDANDPTNVTEVDTSAWRLFGQVGYLFGALEDKLQIGFMAGMGVDKFMFAENNVMPSSSYIALRAGLAGSYAILGPRLMVRADFGYRHVFGAGDLAAAFGATTTGRAFDVGLAATGAMDVGFTYGAHIGFTTYKLAFEGPAEDAEAIDGRDNAFRMGLNLGWSFR